MEAQWGRNTTVNKEKGKVAVKTDFPAFHSLHLSKCFPKDSDSQCGRNRNHTSPENDVHLFSRHSIIALVRI